MAQAVASKSFGSVVLSALSLHAHFIAAWTPRYAYSPLAIARAQRVTNTLSGTGALFVRDDEGDGDCWANARGTPATPSAGNVYRSIGDTAAIRISTSSDSWAREKRVDPNSGSDSNRPRQQHGRYEGDRTALHVERDWRRGLRRMVTQSAHVHACKVRRSDSHCSNLGSTTAKDRCQDLRRFAERPLSCLDLCLWRTCRGTLRRGTLRILLESSMPTWSPSQPTHPTELFGTLQKEMSWKHGDDCTVSTTPRRPWDVWRSCSKFGILLDANVSKTWDLDWKTGYRRNVSTKCSRTGTDGPARHRTTALWRPCSGWCRRAWKRPSCSPMRTRVSRSCSIDCWPTAARNSQSKWARSRDKIDEMIQWMLTRWAKGLWKGQGSEQHEQCRVLELWQVWPLREGL